MAWKKWAGGRYYVAPGVKVFHIYKMRNGRRYSVSTKCSDEAAALREYQRWQQDPDGYRPRGGEERLLLTDELTDEYVSALRARGTSDGRIGKCQAYLRWWRDALADRDLVRLVHTDFTKALKDAPNPGGRIGVIKAFWGWMLKEDRLRNEPLRNIHAPTSTPAQWRRSKVIPESSHRKVAATIEERYRDLLTVLWFTGWHTSELQRFCSGGEVQMLRDVPGNRSHWYRGTPFILHCPRHKSGDVLRTAVGTECAEAARRALEAGPFNRTLLYRAVRKACVDAQVEPFTVGTYRHTLATNLIEQGAAPEAVSAFLGHKSVATTKRFYATMAVVPNPTPQHVLDRPRK